MSATTMHFGPEWMRTKPQPPARSQPPPSPPPTNGLPSSGLSTYSALVSPAPLVVLEKTDEAHPFRYAKEELLNIYQEGGGKGGLGLEVERWEGVVRETAMEPISLREMTDAEKKLFAGTLNSEMRRRPSQSADYLSPLNTSGLERPRMMHSASATTSSPMRERFGGMKRRDSAGGTTDISSLSIPRKPSLSALQSPVVNSPLDATSPRARVGYSSNFDGVLNNGQSWVARRRASEASMKVAVATGRDGQAEQAPKTTGIREEKEDDTAAPSQLPNGEDQSSFASSSPSMQSATTSGLYVQDSAPDMADVGNGFSGSASYNNDRPEAGPPPGLVDLAAVEWSYKDPSGQVQGPFRADLMQKWFNDGYFTPDLVMKRNHLDVNWITVRELVNQATSENIFLTPRMPAGPPGFNRASPMLGFSTPETGYTEPYQPAPVRSLRTSTLESYLAAGSMASDSPSSSFGASQLGNSSPDPSAFGGREHRAYFGGDVNGRTHAFGVQDNSSPYSGNRLGSHDLGTQLQGPSFGNFVQERDPNLNGHNYQQGQDHWGMSSNLQPSSFGIPNNAMGHAHVDLFHHDIGRGFSQNQGVFNANPADFGGHTSGLADMNYANQFGFSGNTHFSSVPEQQQFVTPISTLGQAHQPQTFGLRGLEPLGSQLPQPNDQHAVPTQSAWKTALPESIIAHAVAVTEEPESIVTSDTPGNGVVDSTTQVEATGSSLTVGNLGQHNEQQELAQALEQKLAIAIQDPQAATESLDVSETSLPSAAPETAKSTTKASKKTRKSTTEQAAPLPPPPELPIAAVPKSAWAKEEDHKKKKKGAASSVSLREIQEAEAKKQESRKAAEREKERARASITPTEPKEDLQPFTASWGLPTSQTGARASLSSVVKESSTVSSATPTPVVWTTTAKTPTVKKSMKEIQEEEEKRKKLAAKEATAAATRRAYAETTTKSTATPPAATVTNNTPWSTVGASGKVSTPALPARPSVQTVASFPPPGTSTTTRASAAVQKATPTSALRPRASAAKAEEISDTPSHEFLKWLSDSLKGLNNSVNVEEIMSMLLSFPVDADSSTLEIISDTIYANSTTLDGRRFASEYVTKRKADATTRPKGVAGPGKTPAKPASIADVVKAVPKPAQPEWGFKVVNKKKKGGKP